MQSDLPYTKFVSSLQTQITAESAHLRPEGKSLLFAQKTKAKEVIVLFHGFTNCPKQFEVLGKVLHSLGYTVYIPCAPHHGLKDRLTRDLKKLTMDQLIAYGNLAVDTSKMLGELVSLMGISMGGTLACFLAQTRSDIAVTMPIAPLLGMSFLPPSLTKLFVGLFVLLPNWYMWWDPRTKDKNNFSVEYAYPGYPTKSMVEVLRLGLKVRTDSRKLTLKAKRAVLVLNENEPAVSNPAIMQLATNWRTYHHNTTSLLTLPSDWHLPHDCITPGTPGVDIKQVYSRVILQLQKALNYVHY